MIVAICCLIITCKQITLLSLTMSSPTINTNYIQTYTNYTNRHIGNKLLWLLDNIANLFFKFFISVRLFQADNFFIIDTLKASISSR